MSALTYGQAKLQLLVLLSIIVIPMVFYIWLVSGYANLVGFGVWAFIGLIYIFVLMYMNIKIPEKHRKEVEGKNFLDMEIYKNKEESMTYFFGVAFHQPLKTSEVDAQAIENDPKYIEIKQTCVLESEKQLIEFEMERREQKELFEEANIESVDDTLELEPKESYDKLKEMEEKLAEQMNGYVKENIDKINNELKKLNESIETIQKKIEQKQEVNPEAMELYEQAAQADAMKPKFAASEKNMTDMSYEELNFRLLSLDQCEQNIFNLSTDDYLYVMQYRLFQVRRIFKDLFSEDVSVEMVRNYQPVQFFNGVEFERFVLIMRRPFIEEFSFKQTDADHEGYPVVVQSAKCAAVHAGWVNSKIPIFVIIHSPADAFKKIDVVYDAERLTDKKIQILVRMVQWYKQEYEQSEYAIEEERQFTDLFIKKYDELSQKLEEPNYEPAMTQVNTEERVIKIIPANLKVALGISVILCIIFFITTVLFGSLYNSLVARF